MDAIIENEFRLKIHKTYNVHKKIVKNDRETTLKVKNNVKRQNKSLVFKHFKRVCFKTWNDTNVSSVIFSWLAVWIRSCPVPFDFPKHVDCTPIYDSKITKNRY